MLIVPWYLKAIYNASFLVKKLIVCRYNAVRAGLRDSTVMLTTGEHEYTRYGYKQLTTAGCVDILQVCIQNK